MSFSINARLDAAALAAEFVARGRVQIRDFLHPDDAGSLLAEMTRRQDWHQVLNAGDRVYDLSREVRAQMAPERARALDDAVFLGAREGFQHRYEAIRVPDGRAEREACDDPLARFALWLSQGEARDLLRRIAGNAIAFADAQATAYGPGDFLTIHTDHVAGRQRLAAYVLGLTRLWRAEWGGLLLFHRDDGSVKEGWVPSFNTFNLFAVPQPHSVSLVTRSAIGPRYSITGWLRAAAPETVHDSHADTLSLAS